MSLQQVVQSKPSANGFGRRRVEREPGNRPENKQHSGKLNTRRATNTGSFTGSKIGGYESPSRDRLVYLTTCLIGHRVEVQVKNGSIYNGIFHATNAEEDFGIILKMARMIKDGSIRGPRESISKAPSKILIIPGKELVQVIAKDVTVSREGLSSELQRDKQQELMIDSYISQSRHVEVERELEPWVPDEDVPQCPELESIFDGPWNRNWDQFEVNETLFGVRSTFNEELYTTKLERGPQTRERELEAIRIAREIEGEETLDLHIAEERGMQLQENFDLDEETRFSSVYRDRNTDDSGYEEEEDILLDSRNTETFGGLSGSLTNRPTTDLASQKSGEAVQVSTSSLSVDETKFVQSVSSLDIPGSGTYTHVRQRASEMISKDSPPIDGESRQQASEPSSKVPCASDIDCRSQENLFCEPHGRNESKVFTENEMSADDAQVSKSDALIGTKDESDKGELFLDAPANASSSRASSKGQEKANSGEPLEDSVSVKAQGEIQSVNSYRRPGSSRSSDSVGAASSSGPGLSPSSSVGSLSSEKSTLNPHAKEFKLNPNAKSFIPSQTPLRPPSPVADASFYYPNVSVVPHMHGMPVGIGIGPSYAGHQPVIFNSQVSPVQSQQAYFHPNGPQYGQQILGAPRQVMYMQGYQPEMPYKGREF